MKKIFNTIVLVIFSCAVMAQATGVQVVATATASGNGTCNAQIQGSATLKTSDGCSPTTYCNTCNIGNNNLPILNLEKKITFMGSTTWQDVAINPISSSLTNNIFYFTYSIQNIGEYRVKVKYVSATGAYASCLAVSSTNTAIGYTNSVTFTSIFKEITLANVNFKLGGKSAAESYARTPGGNDYSGKFINFNMCTNSSITYVNDISGGNSATNGAEYQLFVEQCDENGNPYSGTAVGITSFTSGVPSITNLSQLGFSMATGYYRLNYRVRNSCMSSGTYIQRIGYFTVSSINFPLSGFVLIDFNNVVSTCPSSVGNYPTICKNTVSYINVPDYLSSCQIKVYSVNNCSNTLLSTNNYSYFSPNFIDTRSILPGGVANTTTGTYLLEFTANPCSSGTQYNPVKAYINVVSSCKNSEENLLAGSDEEQIDIVSSPLIYYPNPMNDKLYIENATQSDLIIIDMLGKSYSLPVNIEGQTLVFNTTSLSNGWYIIMNRKTNRSYKIVKE